MLLNISEVSNCLRNTVLCYNCFLHRTIIIALEVCQMKGLSKMAEKVFGLKPWTRQH